jgi:hypothetical protein
MIIKPNIPLFGTEKDRRMHQQKAYDEQKNDCR